MRIRTMTLSIVLLLTAAVAIPERANALGLELEGRYWAPSLNGTARFPELEQLPEVDITDLLGMDADGVIEGRLTFRIVLGFYLRGTYQKMSNSGERSLQDILPITLPIEGSIGSSLDFDYGRLALGWRFVSPEKLFSIGAFVEAKGFSGDAAAGVDSPIFSDSISRSFEAVMPSAGVTAEIRPGEKWQIFGEASWVVGEEDADMMDAELGLRYFPIELVGLGAGYRVMDLDGVIDDVNLDVDWKGIFLSAMLRF